MSYYLLGILGKVAARRTLVYPFGINGVLDGQLYRPDDITKGQVLCEEETKKIRMLLSFESHGTESNSPGK